MDKYNESILLKIGILINTIFLVVIMCIYTGVKFNFDNIFESKKSKNQDNLNIIQDGNNVFTNDIKTVNAEIEGSVECNLPGGVQKENCSIQKDIFHKKIVIAFPKGMSGYEQDNIVNTYAAVKNIDINISDVMVKVEISLNSIRDCNVEFSDGKIRLDFFNPINVDMPVIVVDAGHGGDDVGAIERGTYEKNINLTVCERLKEILDNDDKILVYYTREDDTYPSVEERIDFVNELMPDLFISIHSNWYEHSDISGTSVLYNVKDSSEFGSEWLSNIMCQEVIKTCNTNDRGVVDGHDIHIVRNSKVPVALIEMGFMSNEGDFSLLTGNAGQIKLANGIYNGIIRSLTELGKY